MMFDIMAMVTICILVVGNVIVWFIFWETTEGLRKRIDSLEYWRKNG